MSSLTDHIVQEEAISRSPNYTIGDLILDDSLLEQFKICTNKIKFYDKLYHEWEVSKIDKKSKGVIINFYGPPGTGKTIGAEAIASEFNKSIIEVNYSEIYSELSGKSSKNLQKFFAAAKKEDAVLFFDEADTILSKRSSGGNSTDQDSNLTKAIMLKELDSHDGIVIFATNYFDNYDPAFNRRILSHIEFKLPNEQCRELLFKHMLSEKVPGRNVLDFFHLSKESHGLSGGEIKNVIIRTLSKVIEIGHIMQENIIESIRYIKNTKGIIHETEMTKPEALKLIHQDKE